MTPLELISIFHLKATYSNTRIAGKTSNNPGVPWSLSSHRFVYCTSLCAVITTQHFSQIEEGILDPGN